MNAVEGFLSSLNHHQNEIKSHIKDGCHAEAGKSALADLSSLKEVCEELKAIKNSGDKRLDLKEKVKNAILRSTAFVSFLTGTSPLAKNPPVQSSDPSAGSNNFMQQAIRSTAEKTKIAQEQLDMAQKRADDAYVRDMKLNEELMEEIRKLAEFNAVEATTTEVIGVLQQGLQALLKLKERWMEMTLFFQGISNIINVSMGPPLKFLVEDSKRGQKRMTPLLKKIIYGHAYEASKMSFLVNSLSSSYLKLSKEFFMPLVSQMGVLMTLTDKRQIERKKVDLQNQATNMQEQLRKTLQENQDKFKLKYIQRRKELEDAFNALPLDMEEKKAIEDQVHQIQEIVAQSNIDEVNQVPENFDIGDFA